MSKDVFNTTFAVTGKYTHHSVLQVSGGTAAAAPLPFRPGNPALCGSCLLVTPYYCRLGDLLCLFVYPLFVY